MDHPVFVIDDDQPVRESLLMMLRAEGITARGFPSGADFFDRLPDARTACVITDIRMPKVDGVEVVRRLRDLKGDAWPVIVITGHAEVSMAVQLMKEGVVDFIEKPFEPARLIESVHGCLGLLKGRRSHAEAVRRTCELLQQLTPRERQVFDALVQGRSNKEIASTLDISPRTVEIFRAKVMAKMQADNLSALVRMGLLYESEQGRTGPAVDSDAGPA